MLAAQKMGRRYFFIKVTNVWLPKKGSFTKKTIQKWTATKIRALERT